jgi:acyl-CoA thioester hydrolase
VSADRSTLNRRQPWSATVRYAECDQQGIVFNAHYLVWADEAANAWWADLGVTFTGDPDVGEPVVRSASLDWTSSARWGDRVTVTCEVQNVGRTSLTLGFGVRVGDRSCCTVVITYVWVAHARPIPIPDEVRARLGEAP